MEIKGMGFVVTWSLIDCIAPRQSDKPFSHRLSQSETHTLGLPFQYRRWQYRGNVVHELILPNFSESPPKMHECRLALTTHRNLDA